MTEIINIIETAFDQRANLNSLSINAEIKNAVDTTIELLDQGKIRVAEKQNGEWVVNQWVKKAVLLYFKIYDSVKIQGQITQYYDKVPLKYTDYDEDQLNRSGVRIVPDAIVRKGSFIGSNSILMPSYVNIGAYVGTGSLVDSWVNVGSCAQIGNNVHLSMNVGIGGVLEPLQSNPTIIEDDCFIGSGSQIVEGVIVEQGAVIGMGVNLGMSTKIYDRETGKISYGRVPSGAVVIPGTLPSNDGKCSLSCAIIVKRVDENTRKKTELNELLRS